MLNPQPLSLRMQRTVLLPLGLLLLAVAAASVAWLQSTHTASAQPVTYQRDYVGKATVKIKNGAAWQQFNVQVCVTVETNGPNGDITDVYMASSESLECLDPDGLSAIVLANTTGAFGVDTKEDTLVNSGKGWKPTPQKQTANQWLFTIQQPLAAGGAVYLNNGERALTAGTTLTVKFIRDRGGIYFKIAGFAPLNANGLPKVTVEIESASSGLDATPSVINSSPVDGTSGVGSDTVAYFTYDEPVTVDPSGPYIQCQNFGDIIVFSATDGSLVISGQGTTVIGLAAVPNLPEGGFECFAIIPANSVDDVDPYDPPSNWPGSAGITSFIVAYPEA